MFNLLLNAIEQGEKLSKCFLDFSKERTVNGSNEMFMRTGLRDMMEGKAYRMLDKYFVCCGAY